MEKYHVSVVIPAHNEEKYVVRCIESVKRAAEFFRGNVEIIVVCNRCTDRTAELAEANGARVLFNEDRCIAKVRNTGIFAAKGWMIMTIDCDNRMTKGTIAEAYHMLRSGKYIGGGAPLRFERYSFPLLLNDVMCRVGFGLTGLYCGIFWGRKSDIVKIGGFPDIKAMEDVSFAKAMKSAGKMSGQKYGCLKRNVLINSTRKFDEMGDLMYLKLMVTNLSVFVKAFFGNSRELDELLDRLFYDYNG